VDVWSADLGWTPGAHQITLSLPLLNWTKGEEYDERLVSLDKDKKTIYALLSQVKQTHLEEINLLPIKGQSRITRNETKS